MLRVAAAAVRASARARARPRLRRARATAAHARLPPARAQAPALRRLGAHRLGAAPASRAGSSGAPPPELPLELYHDLCDRTLEGVQEVYEEFADAAPQHQMDIEYASGVLNVTLGAHGTFVLNKQTPNLQIWLSSPVSGPLRYDFCPATAGWVNSRDRHELLPLLVADFEQLVGERLDFDGVADDVREATEGLSRA